MIHIKIIKPFYVKETPTQSSTLTLGDALQPASISFQNNIKLAIHYCHPGACQTTQKLVHFYMLITLKTKK